MRDFSSFCDFNITITAALISESRLVILDLGGRGHPVEESQ